MPEVDRVITPDALLGRHQAPSVLNPHTRLPDEPGGCALRANATVQSGNVFATQCLCSNQMLLLKMPEILRDQPRPCSVEVLVLQPSRKD